MRPTPGLPAQRTHLLSWPPADGAAAEPEAEAEAERGAQQHRGDQQLGSRSHCVPAQQQPRVAPAGLSAGHRGHSGRSPAASRLPPPTTPASRPEHCPRQVCDAELGARAGQGRSVLRRLSGLCGRLPL